MRNSLMAADCCTIPKIHFTGLISYQEIDEILKIVLCTKKHIGSTKEYPFYSIKNFWMHLTLLVPWLVKKIIEVLLLTSMAKVGW